MWCAVPGPDRPAPTSLLFRSCCDLLEDKDIQNPISSNFLVCQSDLWGVEHFPRERQNKQSHSIA